MLTGNIADFARSVRTFSGQAKALSGNQGDSAAYSDSVMPCQIINDELTFVGEKLNHAHFIGHPVHELVPPGSVEPLLEHDIHGMALGTKGKYNVLAVRVGHCGVVCIIISQC